MWLGGARKGRLWPCYAELLAEREKSGTLGDWRRPKRLPERGTVEKEDEEEEPATERRRESTQI